MRDPSILLLPVCAVFAGQVKKKKNGRAPIPLVKGTMAASLAKNGTASGGGKRKQKRNNKNSNNKNSNHHYPLLSSTAKSLSVILEYHTLNKRLKQTTAHASASTTSTSTSTSTPTPTTTKPALEAASTLVWNHAAVLKDCLGSSEPTKSRGHVSGAGASAKETADTLLRHVAGSSFVATHGGGGGRCYRGCYRGHRNTANFRANATRSRDGERRRHPGSPGAPDGREALVVCSGQHGSSLRGTPTGNSVHGRRRSGPCFFFCVILWFQAFLVDMVAPRTGVLAQAFLDAQGSSTLARTPGCNFFQRDSHPKVHRHEPKQLVVRHRIGTKHPHTPKISNSNKTNDDHDGHDDSGTNRCWKRERPSCIVE